MYPEAILPINKGMCESTTDVSIENILLQQEKSPWSNTLQRICFSPDRVTYINGESFLTCNFLKTDSFNHLSEYYRLVCGKKLFIAFIW